MEVLRTKHPDARPPSAASTDMYTDQPPKRAPVDITNGTVTEVEGRLSRGAGLGGMDSVRLQHWLLRLGAASEELRLTVADFTEWLGSGKPPWSTHFALLSGRLIILDKQPGVRPFRVEETWQRLMEK